MSIERLKLTHSQLSTSCVLTGMHQLDALGWFLLPQLTEDRNVTLLVSKQTWESLGVRIKAALSQHAIQHQLILLPHDSDKLQMPCALEVLDAFSHAQMNTQSTILAVGDEHILRLALFIASSYEGGIKAICVPTTLLAAIQTAVSDTWSLEHERGRSLSCNARDHQLLVSLEQFTSLNALDYQAALVEMVRTALLDTEESLFWLIENAGSLQARDLTVLLEAYQHCLLSRETVLQKGYIAGECTAHECGLGATLMRSLSQIVGVHHAQAALEALRLTLRLSCEKTGLDPEILHATESLLQDLGCTLLSDLTDAHAWINQLFEPMSVSAQELEIDLLRSIGSQEQAKLDKSFVKPRIAAWCAAKVE